MNRRTIDPILREAVRAELERLPGRLSAVRSPANVVGRRWVPVVTSVVVAVLVVVVGLLVVQGRPVPPAKTAPAPTVKASKSSSSAVTTPLGAVVLSGISVPTTGVGPAAADDAALYVALNRKEDGSSWVIERIDARTGAVTTRSLTLDYLSRIAVGPDGVYVSTSVVTRFQQIPDTILRLDPTTLRTVTVRHFPPSAARGGSVVLTASGSRLVATLGDGHVLALDPVTLATKHSIDLLNAQDLRNGISLSDPVFSDGRVWVLGADHGRRLLALNPDTLSTVTATAPLAEQQRGEIVPSARGVYLAGAQLMRVATDGSVTTLATLRPAVLQAWTSGTDVLVSDGQNIDEYAPSGTRLATLTLQSDRAQVVAFSPHITWVVGLPGIAPGLSAIDNRR